MEIRTYRNMVCKEEPWKDESGKGVSPGMKMCSDVSKNVRIMLAEWYLTYQMV